MLQSRWAILALIFLVRMGMGLQFQAVPALAPLYLSGFAVSVVDVGLLIGLYFAPGVFLALPGGAIGKRYGDKQTVLLGLALMIAGGLLMLIGTTWPLQLAGRLIAGIGGVLLNVVMSKLVTDWFAGKEMATAMAIFVNSWPVSVALGLIVWPLLANLGGLNLAMSGVVAYLCAGFIAFALFYHAPPGQGATLAGNAAGSVTVASRPEGAALTAVVVAALIWGCFNGSLAMVFSFGPLMLTERGWGIAAASSTTSIVLWLMGLSVPLGGILADRTKRVSMVLLGGFVAPAVALLVATRVGNVPAAFAAIGLVGGIAAGPIMSLPSRVLTPATRAIGMGIFFTVYYPTQLVGPWIAGKLAKMAGNASVAFDFGAVMLVLCVVLYGWFVVVARQGAASVQAKAAG